MRRTKPISAYIAVVFAFFSFSSSPYDFVYCIPAHTIAPTARSAPKDIATVAIFCIRSCTHFLSLDSPLGLIPTVQSQQFARVWTAVLPSIILHAHGQANTLSPKKKKERKRKIYFINSYIARRETKEIIAYPKAIHIAPIAPYVRDFQAFFTFSSFPSARKSSYAT